MKTVLQWPRYTLAVDRRYRKEGKAETDFISCVTFGKNAEFAEKYLKRGLKILSKRTDPDWKLCESGGK